MSSNIWDAIVKDSWSIWTKSPSKHAAIFLATLLVAEFSTALLVGKTIENHELRKTIDTMKTTVEEFLQNLVQMDNISNEKNQKRSTYETLKYIWKPVADAEFSSDLVELAKKIGMKNSKIRPLNKE